MSKRTNNHRWTAQQTATLRQLYPDLPSAEIAAQLGIATKQVYYKAHKMGLKKSAEFYATRDAGRPYRRVRVDCSVRARLIGERAHCHGC